VVRPHRVLANLSFRNWLLLAPGFAAGFRQCDQIAFTGVLV
jgi:hypothetical protein